MEMKNIDILGDYISKHKNIVVVPHTSPDGDAIGSCLALVQLLNKLGHNTNMISPNEAPYFLRWIPGFKNIIYYDSEKEKCSSLINDSELIFTLDFNDLKRIGDLGEVINLSSSKIIMIDHHQNPNDYADLIFSEPSTGSTCELLYEIIASLGYEKKIDAKIASCLYLGIMTDTGSFQYSNVTQRTHQIISKLIKFGAIQNEIHNKVYNESSISRLKVLGSALKNLRLIKELNTVFMFLEKEDLKKFDFKKGDSEGIVNYGLSLKNIIFSVIFIEDLEEENKIKISFRSQGEFSCNKFANTHFNGGGHINAAGGVDNGPLDNTINKFKKVIYSYKKQLNK